MGFIKHRSQVAHLQIFVILKSSLRNNFLRTIIFFIMPTKNTRLYIFVVSG